MNKLNYANVIEAVVLASQARPASDGLRAYYEASNPPCANFEQRQAALAFALSGGGCGCALTRSNRFGRLSLGDDGEVFFQEQGAEGEGLGSFSLAAEMKRLQQNEERLRQQYKERLQRRAKAAKAGTARPSKESSTGSGVQLATSNGNAASSSSSGPGAGLATFNGNAASSSFSGLGAGLATFNGNAASSSSTGLGAGLATLNGNAASSEEIPSKARAAKLKKRRQQKRAAARKALAFSGRRKASTPTFSKKATRPKKTPTAVGPTEAQELELAALFELKLAEIGRAHV